MDSRKNILVCDDELNLRRVLGAILKRQGHTVCSAQDGYEAIELLKKNEVHTVITDLRMPKVDGMDLLKHIVAEYPDVPVIILTAHGSVDNAVAAVKLGAFDYIEKPFEQDQIKQVIATALRTNELRRKEVRLIGATKGKGRYGLIGSSVAMQAIYNVIEKVADTPSTVLISGESGTGKELIAQALHQQSLRRDAPLIKVNCAAIPDNLIESELFGYEKGAFTGAVNSKPGRFELADRGTLFLDEIGEIPNEMQVKLLRALQEGEFERVGGIRTIKVNVRLMAATNRDLVSEIERGKFREDLYYRLNVVPIRVPPLRERIADIPDLVEHVLAKFKTRLGREIPEVSSEAMHSLQEYAWPGNVRELENVLERTVLFCSDRVIKRAHLPEEIQGGSDKPSLGGKWMVKGPGVEAPSHPLPTEKDGPREEGIPPVAGKASFKEIVRAETERVERQLILGALRETGWNVTHAAKQLKISRKSLQIKMKELGLRDKESESAPFKKVDE